VYLQHFGDTAISRPKMATFLGAVLLNAFTVGEHFQISGKVWNGNSVLETDRHVDLFQRSVMLCVCVTRCKNSSYIGDVIQRTVYRHNGHPY